MNRKQLTMGLQFAGMLVAVASLSLGPLPPAAAAKAPYTYDFEGGLKPWVAGTGTLLELDKSENLCPMELGTSMARVTLPVLGANRFGNDAAYMAAAFPTQPGDRVTVDWAAKAADGCATDTCAPVVYVGSLSRPPFVTWATAKGVKGPYGWMKYHYECTMALDVPGRLQTYVALGIAGSSPFASVSLGIDCVQVTVLPQAH